MEFLQKQLPLLAFNALVWLIFFCLRSSWPFQWSITKLSNLLTINRLINTTNLLATSLSFLKEAFFIGVTIGVRYILCFIWKDFRFCLCYSPPVVLDRLGSVELVGGFNGLWWPCFAVIFDSLSNVVDMGILPLLPGVLPPTFRLVWLTGLTSSSTFLMFSCWMKLMIV